MGALEIAHSLSAARKAVQLYPPEHPTHREAVRDLTAAVNEAVEVRPLALNLHKGRLYHGSEVLTDTAPASRAIAEAMEVRRIESLTFHMGFNETDATGVAEVLSLKPSPDLEIQTELEERGVRAVTVSELEDESAFEALERDRRREADRALYRQAVNAVRSLRSSLAGNEDIDPNEGPRALVGLALRVAEDPEAIVGLARMTGHGDPALFHALSVSLYSLVIGHALGLSEKALIDLGMAGLMHDAGKVRFDLADPEQAAQAKERHPVIGAEMLGSLADEDRLTVMAAYEHHMGMDSSGWPERPDDSPPHPYSRIVAVANRYDNLTKPVSGPSRRPDEAIAIMLREASGGPLDPIITRLFAQIVGVFPIGSALRLSDMSVALVTRPGEDPMRPLARLVLRSDGTEVKPAQDVDLKEDDRGIVELIDPLLADVAVADHL